MTDHTTPAPVRYTAFGFDLADLLEGFGSAIIVTDLGRTVLWVNERFRDLFGLSEQPDELIGRPAQGLAQEVAGRLAEPADFSETIQAIVDRGVSQVDRLAMADGRQLLRSYWPVRRDGERVAHVWRYDDVTEEELRDEALDRATVVLDELVWAHGAVVRDRTGAELFAVLLEGLIRVSGSAYGFLGEVDDDEHGDPFLTSWATTNIAWSEETKAFYEHAMATDGFMQFRNLDTLFGVTLRTGEAVFSNDPVHDPRAGGIPDGHPPLVSYLGLPIHRDDRLIGMVGLAGRAGGYDESVVATLQPLLAASGSLLDAFVIERERQAAEAKLRDALLAAERANAAKSRLLGRVSHELRTPLNAVLGFAELLACDETDPVRSEWLERIRQAGHHVLSEVNDLIDLSAAEAGRLSVRIGPVAIDELVGEVIAMVAPAAAGAGVRVRSTVAPGTTASADPARLRTVMVNLVSNAVKFNDAGGTVEVSASVVGDRIEVSVADDGPGIAAERIGDAFAMFERLDAPRRSVPGAGLGLTIARQYCEAMGGGLMGRPRSPRGLEMVVALPL